MRALIVHDCTILSAHNRDVDDMNHNILNEFPGEEIVFQSSDSVKNDGLGPGEEFMYPVEYLNSINTSGLPLSKLKLKIGAPVMILRNMDPESGVCNGTRGIAYWRFCWPDCLSPSHK